MPAFFLRYHMDKPQILPDGIKIPSSTDFLADVDQYLEERLVGAGIDTSTVTDLAISVSELVNNAILHGNKSDLSKSVHINITIDSSEVRIVVTDEGEQGYNPEELENPIADENLLKEVGRGLFIVRNFVDDLRVEQVDSGGTRVEIIKKF